jgi:hypothetical protein
MSKNTIVDNGNGTSCVVINSNKYGQFMIVIDTDMVSVINGHTWSISKLHNMFYASTSMTKATGKRGVVYMHAVINGTPFGFVTDHISGDSLDNRRCNLRSITNQQNQFNRKTAKGYTTLPNGKYRAQLQLNNRFVHIGVYDTEQEAHEAYLEAKKIYHRI